MQWLAYKILNKRGNLLRTWFGIFNIIALGLLSLMMGIFYTQTETMKKEYDTHRLNYALTYSAEAAFMETLNVGDVNLSYTNMSDVELDPTYCLDIFEAMMCLNYGMSDNEENRLYIESCIPTAVLACNDGYYITLLTDVNQYDEGTQKEEGFKWSPKLPYTVECPNGEISVRLNSQQWIKVTSNSNDTLSLLYGNSYADDAVSGLLSKEIVSRSINSTLTNAIARNIDYVGSLRGGVNYSIYLPARQTQGGINEIMGPSLLILLQGADFSGEARVEEAIIAGLKTIKKVRTIGFVDYDGLKRYCYETQLPDDLLNSAVSFFNSTEEAAKAGYAPSYQYLQKKIVHD